MNPSEVRRLASLARIHLTEEEVERFAGQLASVVEYFQTLTQVPAADRAAQPGRQPLPPHLREDVAAPFPGAERLVEKSAGSRAGFIEVPRVLD